MKSFLQTSLKILAGLTLVMISGIIAYLVTLQLDSRNNQNQNTDTNLKKVETPDILISEFTKKIPKLGSGVAEDKLVALGFATLYSPSKSSRFTLSIPSVYRVSMSSTDLQGGLRSIEKGTDSYLTSKGLVAEEGSSDTTKRRYVSENVVCDTYLSSIDNKVYGVLSCNNLSLLKHEYSSLESLIEISKDSEIVASHPVISVSTLSQEKTRLKILSYNTSTHSIQAYFATTDEKWEYLGKKQVTGVEGAEMEPPAVFNANIEKKMEKYGQILRPLLSISS